MNGANPKVRRGWIGVEVYRGAGGGDCTLDGVTSRHARLFVPCDRVAPGDDPPEELQLLPGEKGGVGNFVPAAVQRAREWSMFGGNFVWTSDGRFRAQYGDRPVAVHDRVER